MSNGRRIIVAVSVVAVALMAFRTDVEAKKKRKKGAKSMVEQPVRLGVPLDMADKEMMKTGPMRNMDKYMGSREAMMTRLPEAMVSKQKVSTERGRRLFNSTGLSANGQSCASCHPGGGTTGGTVQTPMPSELTGKPYQLPVPSLVGAAATFPKFKVPNDRVIALREMHNNCIMMFLAAKPLPLHSQEAIDLAAYVTSLSTGEEVEPGKMPEMM